jgi:aminomethyltransferase
MVIEHQGRAAGTVTSGSFSPSLERPIALAYVETALATIGTMLDVAAGESRLPARVVKTPFWTQGSRRS